MDSEFKPDQDGLILEGIQKSYSLGRQDIPVLNGIDITLPKGSFATLMGPSGSGKSTLLHILAGMDIPDSGRVWLNQKEVTNFDEKQRTLYRRETVSIVFQFFHLLPYLSSLENAALPLYIRGYSKKEAWKKAEYFLERVGLSERRKNLPTELSGGERQRVAIARALSKEPELLLADEPTGNLDTKTASRMLDLFLELQREFQFTFLLVTHDKDIGIMGDKQLHLQDGRFV